MLPEVWMYWRDVSRGGSIFNAHLSENYREEWNPVARDNIMYSAYVQSMALIYNYLFDDDRYALPGALTFRYWSYFWGGEEKGASNTTRSRSTITSIGRWSKVAILASPASRIACSKYAISPQFSASGCMTLFTAGR